MALPGLRSVLSADLDGRHLLVGLVDPRDLATVQRVEAEAGHPVRPVLLSGVQLDEAIRFFEANGYGERPLTLTVHEPGAGTVELPSLLRAMVQLRGQDGHGRAVAWERLSTSLEVKNAIREGKAYALRSLMQSHHEELSSFDQSLAQLVIDGIVTTEEAHKYADSPAYVDDLVGVRGRP